MGYNVSRFGLDDMYRPVWHVVKFETLATGPVEVRSNVDVETYLLINRGRGGRLWVSVAPYVANRTVTKPLELELGRFGNVTVCTVGKYASKGWVRDIDGWREGTVSTGYYRSVVHGRGDAVRLV